VTTNNLSLNLKSHALTEKDLPIGRNPKPIIKLLLVVLMCRLTGVTAVCTKCNRRVFQFISVYVGKSREQSTLTGKFLGHNRPTDHAFEECYAS